MWTHALGRLSWQAAKLTRNIPDSKVVGLARVILDMLTVTITRVSMNLRLVDVAPLRSQKDPAPNRQVARICNRMYPYAPKWTCNWPAIRSKGYQGLKLGRPVENGYICR